MLLIGSAQSLKFSLQSAQVARAILSENDLKASIAHDLKADCWTPLQPSALTNTQTPANEQKGIGTLNDGLTAVKVGDFNGDIEVVKIELNGRPSERERTLVVYYKKKGLGDQLNTLGTGGCSPKKGETPAVTTDCYYHRCSINYIHNPDLSLPEEKDCTLTTCHNISQEVLAEVDQKVVVKITSEFKNKDCTQTGQYIKGFDDSGNPDCVAPILTKDCGAGKVVRGIRQDGSLICADGCAGGKILTTIAGGGRECQCPAGQYWENASCRTCSSNRQWVQADSRCMACIGGGATWNLSGGQYQCQCPDRTVKKKTYGVIFVALKTDRIHGRVVTTVTNAPGANPIGIMILATSAYQVNIIQMVGVAPTAGTIQTAHVVS